MKKLFFVFVCAFLPCVLMASDIESRLKAILPDSAVTDLLKHKKVQNSSYRIKGAVPVLVPDNEFAREAVSYWTGEEAPFFSESLYLYKKPEDTETSDDLAKVSRILRSISRLEGISYYSTSRKQMRILYEKSYVIENQKSKRKTADPVSGSADGVSILAFQKDLTFGECIYQYNYRQSADSVAFYSCNLEPMSYAFIRVIDPEKLRNSLVVQDLGDYLLVYSITRANFAAIPGLETKINASFSTRMEAVYDWFLKEYERQ
jgi:hypothetical protein